MVRVPSRHDICGLRNQEKGWHFAPIEDNFQRSIMFHEPHPVAKIPFWNYVRMGRRLERVFGWTKDTFERREKAL